MKRYIAFAYGGPLVKGGLKDVIGNFAAKEEAQKSARQYAKFIGERGEYEILDTFTGEVTAYSEGTLVEGRRTPRDEMIDRAIEILKAAGVQEFMVDRSRRDKDREPELARRTL